MGTSRFETGRVASWVCTTILSIVSIITVAIFALYNVPLLNNVPLH